MARTLKNLITAAAATLSLALFSVGAIGQTIYGVPAPVFKQNQITGDATAQQNITIPAPLSLTIQPGATFSGGGTITPSSIQPIANNTFIGNTSGGTASPSAQAVPNAALATMPAQTMKCNLTAGVATPTDCSTGTVANSLLSINRVLTNYLSGLGLANDGTLPNTVIDVAAGSAADSANQVIITQSAFTKSISGAWVAGSGQNGMGQGLTATANTWYDVCLANNSGSPDIFFDTAVSGATPCAQHRPGGITDTAVRRLGSIKLDASIHILGFFQQGNRFLWKAPVVDVSAQAITTTARTLFTLGSVPPGVRVEALVNLLYSAATGSVLITSPDVSDVAVSSAADWGIGTANASAGLFSELTNLSAQIGARAGNTAGNLTILTRGWDDFRGQL